MDNKLYISYSSILRFKTCPRKYWLSKQYKNKTLFSSFQFGKAFENAVEVLLLGKSLEEAIELFNEQWKTLPPDNYNGEIEVFDNLSIEYYASDIDLNCIGMAESVAQEWCLELQETDDYLHTYKFLLKEGVETEDEKRFMNRLAWLSLQVKGHLMLEAFHDDILPNITKVISIQEEVEFVTHNGAIKKGFIDLIAEYKGYNKPIIFDLKSAAFPYSLHKLHTSEQLIGYVLAKEEELDTNLMGYLVILKKPVLKKFCSECQLEKTSMKKKCVECGSSKFDSKLKCGTQILIDEVPEYRLDGLVEDDEQTVKAIEAGIDYKNPDSCMMFNKPCEFYDICHNNKKVEDIKHLEIKEKE